MIWLDLYLWNSINNCKGSYLWNFYFTTFSVLNVSSDWNSWPYYWWLDAFFMLNCAIVIYEASFVPYSQICQFCFHLWILSSIMNTVLYDLLSLCVNNKLSFILTLFLHVPSNCISLYFIALSRHLLCYNIIRNWSLNIIVSCVSLRMRWGKIFIIFIYLQRNYWTHLLFN